MSDQGKDDGNTEDGFFSSAPREDGAGGLGHSGRAPAAPRRDSRLLARSPVFAFVAAALSVWLLFTLWPDVAYFFASRTPVDLGGPGAYHFEEARENRLVQIRGPLEPSSFARKRLTGDTRYSGRLVGTPVIVDHPGRVVPPLYEGRLLPASRRDDYQPEAGAFRIGPELLVLRDGERPRSVLPQVIGALLLLVVLFVNVRALVRPLFVPSPE